MARDPYTTLGVSPTVSDAELRSAYRKLVLRHHPDHNGGSAESARRFEEIQEAYSEARRLRSGRAAGAGTGGARTAGSSRQSAPPRSAPPPRPDPDLDARLEDIERELREANEARERARRAAREAAAAARAQQAASRSDGRRATDEELGYVTTDDSFTKILSDVRDELFGRVEEVRESQAGQRVADLIDELAAKLRGE